MHDRSSGPSGRSGAGHEDAHGGADPGVPPPASDDRRLATIRGLLAKAEATEFAEEAEAFFAKASELIARYAVDDAMLWAGADEGGRDAPAELRLEVHAPYLAQKALLVDAVARAHGCRAVRLPSGPGAGREHISVVGFPADLKWVEALVTSLLVQLVGAMRRGTPAGLTASGSAGWRRSFIVGFAEEVSTRLEADRAQEVHHRASRSGGGGGAGEGSVAMVLASRSEEVDQEFRRRYPRVRSAWASSGSSRAGHAAGRSAGRDASLTRHRLGGRRALGSGG